MLLTLVVFLTLVVPCIHFLDRLLDLKRANEGLSKNECKVLRNLIFFDPPKLGTPPKLEALMVIGRL